ncbi:MAG: hypothetical protein PVH63_00170 [Balneolaceae bacterium]
MKQVTIRYLILALVLTLNACSSSPTDPNTNGGNTSDPPEPTLTADISVTPESPEVGTQVSLDASGSTDDQGIGYSVQWSFESKPSNSNAKISNADQSTATFTPDVAGDFVVSLEISNSSEGVSDDAQKTVTSIAAGPVELNGVISQDSTLTDVFTDPSMPDYLVTGDLEVYAKLTVNPGVVIYFQEDQGMTISSQNGVLVAEGTVDNKIVFTGESRSVNGFWRGINVYSNSVENSISEAEISYAGSKSAGTYFDAAALTIDNAKVQLSDLTISHSGGYGIQTRRSGSDFAMSNIRFEKNDMDQAYVHISQLGYFDAASSFDGGYVTAFGGGTTQDMTISALDSAKYQIVDNVEFKNAITIDAGANFEFAADAGIVVRDGASVIAKGTQNNKIVFTGTSKSPGAWRGIFIGSNSVDNIFENVDVSYGGSTNMATYFDKTNMVIDNAKITLKNVSFTGSAGYGIQTRRTGSDFSVENCSFDNNASSDMLIHPEQIAFIDNQTDFNGGTVEVFQGDTRNTGSDTWSKLNNGTYLFSDNVSIINNVTIEAGALFEMGTDVELSVKETSSSTGVINAVGTAASPIVFTGKSKAKGAWRGILISSGSVDNTMDHVKIEYGGSSGLATYMDAGNLGVYNNGFLNLSNASIENSANYGIIVRTSASATLNSSNVSFSGNDNMDTYTY